MYQISGRASRRWAPKSVGEMGAVAEELLRLWPQQVWLLHGNLGSGKTTLVRAALRRLGYRGVVSSPTFTLSKHYSTPHIHWTRVLHIDAYRIRRESEEAALDIAQALSDKHCLILIEWPERLQSSYDWEPIHISLLHKKNGRQIVAGPRPLRP